jgi:hypothetical protein
MRKVLSVLFALLILSLGASVVSAQIPFVQVYFDQYMTKASIDQCPDADIGTVTGSLYVGAINFNCWMSAIEYKIEYPPELSFLGDNTGGLDIGSSPVGIATAWTFPLNAFGPALVNEVSILWMCRLCNGISEVTISVVPHPESGLLRAIRWPDNSFVDAVGQVSLICTSVPAEETTWGSIKALYNN